MQYREIHYAVIIDTKTTETLSSVGMVNGKIKIISDGYTVPPTAHFEDDSPVGTDWVTLLKTDGFARTGTRIDITTGGDYAYLSGMNISLANRNIPDTASYHDSLQQLQQAWLVGASVQFFVVIAEEFIQRWEGVVDGVDFDEETFTFSASDKLTKEFKQLPNVSGDQIAIGAVKYSPLIPVQQDEEENILLESHVVCRIIPYQDKVVDSTYASKAEAWSAGSWADGSMDMCGFGSQYQYPSQLANTSPTQRQRRLVTPVNNRDFWVLIESSIAEPDWIGKTATIDGVDHLIIDITKGIVPNTIYPALWILVKDLSIEATTESLFGVPSEIKYAPACANPSDAIAVLDSLKSFSTDKLTITISDKLKVLQFSKDTSLTELETDDNGNIKFYTKGADGTMVAIKVQATVDINNNIVIVNESKRRELVIPDKVYLFSDNKLGMPAKFDETSVNGQFPDYEPIYNTQSGSLYTDKSFFDGSQYDLRDVRNGGFSNIFNRTCLYGESNFDDATEKWGSIKALMEFSGIDLEQDYKPFLLIQSDLYDAQQWAASYDSAQYAHRPALLPINSSLNGDDPAHSSRNNNKVNLYFDYLDPVKFPSWRACTADVWVVNIYPVTVHPQHGYITPTGLDDKFLPTVPYTFDLPKRVNRSDLIRTSIENPTYPDNGRYTKMYAYQSVLPLAVTTAPIELIPDNDTIGASLIINYYRYYKDVDYTIESIWTQQTVTTDMMRIGDSHAQYVQMGTDSGNDRSFLLNTPAVGSGTTPLNSAVPVISADDIKTGTTKGVTRILFEISSEYFIDHPVNSLAPDFSVTMVPFTIQGITPEVLKIMGIGLMIDEPIEIGDLFVSLKSKVGDLVPTDNVYGALHYMTDTYSGLLGDYSSLPTQRTNLWNTGRVLQKQQNTFNYIQELCQQSFVCGWTNRMGDVNYSILNPSFTASSDDDLLVLHDEDIIIRDSITGFSLSPLSQVYNEFNVNFAYNYATGEYDKKYSVKNVDKDSFPPSVVKGFKVTNDPVEAIVTYFSEKLTAALIMPSEYYVEGNWGKVFIASTYDGTGSLGHKLFGTVTAIEDLNGGLSKKIRFTIDPTKSTITQSEDLQLEGCYLNQVYTTKLYDDWTDYVIGIDDYLMAKDIWELCHSGYLQTKTVNKAPENLTNLIWATDLGIIGDDRADLYNEYAYQYLKLLAKWATRQKWIVEYDLPVSPESAKLEIMQRVKFHDPIITPNGYGVGYITSINVVSEDDLIHVGLMFEKLGSRQIVPTEQVVITETGTAITITETGTAITITETI